MKKLLPKFTKHDLYTAAILFAGTFLSALSKGGSVSGNALLSAAVAAVGAVVHSYLGKSV